MNSIIEYLKKYGRIDSESVQYNIPSTGSGPFPFTKEEFNSFLNGLFQVKSPEDWDEYLVSEAYFPTWVFPFSFEENDYRMVVMKGQGTARSLCTIIECERWMDHIRQMEQ